MCIFGFGFHLKDIDLVENHILDYRLKGYYAANVNTCFFYKQ